VTTAAAPALAPSLAALDAAVSWCSFRLGMPPRGVAACPARPGARPAGETGGWIRCSDALAVPAFFPRWQEELRARMAQAYATVPPVTPAGYVMGWYAGMFGYLGGTLFHLHRRVPSLAPEHLAFRLDPVQRRPVEVALLDDAFGCLPADPAAGAAAATVLPDDSALAAALRAEVAAHGERFVAAYRASSRFGPHTLWGAVTDALDRGVWHAAHQRGDDAAGASDAALVLPRRLPPFTSGSTIRAEGGRWTRTRQSCCFYYKLPGVQSPCSTCPRLAHRRCPNGGGLNADGSP